MNEGGTFGDALASESERSVVIADPVCGKRIGIDEVAAQADHNGWAYFFCSERCQRHFAADPRRYADPKIQAGEVK